MKKLICIMMLLSTTVSWSQKNTDTFEDGYIVTSKGDTLVGLIKVVKEIETYTKVVFKDKKNKTKMYNASQLLEYFYFNNQYVSAYYENKPCFFKLLVSGKVKLFKLMLPNGNEEPELVFFALPKGEGEIIKLDEDRLNKQLQRLFKVNDTLKDKLAKQKYVPMNTDTLQYYFTAFNYNK